MSQIPLGVPRAAGRVGADEFAQLEMQREQLQAMVADQAKVRERLRLLVPGLMVGLAVLCFFGVRSGEMAGPAAISTLVIAAPLLFVLRRQIRSFANQLFVGEPGADEWLAECEASLSRLRERRS